MVNFWTANNWISHFQDLLQLLSVTCLTGGGCEWHFFLQGTTGDRDEATEKRHTHTVNRSLDLKNP